MKTIAIALAALGVAVATSAMAAPGRATDVDYLQASRCKGLAEGLGVDSKAIDSFLKVEGRTRMPIVQENADAQRVRAKRDVTRAESKTRFEAELAGACAAYTGPTKALAAR